LAPKGRRRAWQGHERLRVAVKQAFEPQVPEWGNPPGVIPGHPDLVREASGGTETS
jgi:hypothetical protein